MSWYSIMGVISAIALFIPILLIIALRLYTRTSFIALMIYFLLPGVHNLAKLNVFKFSIGFVNALGIITNLLDAPLMLLFLIFFSTKPIMTKRIHMALYAFLAFEVAILIAYGFTQKTVTIVLGPGIAFVLVPTFIFFLKNVKLAITHSKHLGKAIMVSSSLLLYSIFSIIYVYYFVLEILQNDTRLVYYILNLLSALLMAAGIWIENKRIKKLTELKHTRKELATIYGQTKTAVIDKDSRFLKKI
jgi:hypothetical protein